MDIETRVTTELRAEGTGREITGLIAPFRRPVIIGRKDGTKYAETMVEDSMIPLGGAPLFAGHPEYRAHDKTAMPMSYPGEFATHDAGLYGRWTAVDGTAGDGLLAGIRSGRYHGLSTGFLPDSGQDEWNADRSAVTRHGGVMFHVAAVDRDAGQMPAYPEAKVLEVRNGVPEVRDGKAPYGDVEYADPGYQDDKVKRYPIDTAAHVRAALSYFGQPANREPYTAAQAKAILGRIRHAAVMFGIGQGDSEQTRMHQQIIDLKGRGYDHLREFQQRDRELRLAEMDMTEGRRLHGRQALVELRARAEFE